MSCEFWIDVSPSHLRVAAVQHNKLIGYMEDVQGTPLYTGAVYQGKVTKVNSAQAFAEVDLGLADMKGFLPLKRTVPAVGELIVVECIAPPREDKTLTLKRLNTPLSGKTVRQLQQGLDAVARLWRDLPPQHATSNHAAMVERCSAEGISATLYPKENPLLLLKPQDKLPLFEVIDLESQIERIKSRIVPLACGGSLIFDRTAVGHVIDVNSGTSTLTPAALNRAALQEIAQQLRWRNLGGIILIDLVGNARHAGTGLREFLQAQTAQDPRKVEVCGLTSLGLMECMRARYGAEIT